MVDSSINHALLPFRDACIVHKLGENAKSMNKYCQFARKYPSVLDKNKMAVPEYASKGSSSSQMYRQYED
jgi:hypothetical protein